MGLTCSLLKNGFQAADSTIRVLFGDATLVKIPESAAGDDAVLTPLLLLTDVMGTGHHSVVSANQPRKSIHRRF
jgi:hypothetical protein